MKLHQILKVKHRSKKRLGRGLGSGKGKTGGRGTKGQKARGTIPLAFSGDLAFFKKLPLKKGQGNTKVSQKPNIITLTSLNNFKAKSIVNIEELIKSKIITEKGARLGVKVLAVGELTHSLVVKLPTSKSARQKIEEKGGSVEDV